MRPRKTFLIKGNAGYTVNVPTFGQLYQASHGSIDLVRGNPNLTEEKVVSYDLGLEYRFRKDRVLQAALFRTQTRDLIVFSRGADLVYQPVNIDRGWRQGLELTAKYAWDFGLSLDVNCILQDSENEDTGKALAYTPDRKLKVTAKYTLADWKTRIETTFRYQGERYSESEGREADKLGDYTTVELKFLQPFSVGRTACEAYLNIYNLFDRDFEIHYGYPDDGLRFIVGLNVTF